MSDLDNIVTVSITSDTRTPSATGFGTPLVLSYHTRFADHYRSYAALSEMTADGFASYDDAYRMAQSAFGQTPRPETVLVGRLPAAPVFRTQVTIASPVVGTVFKCAVIAPTTGVAYTFSYTFATTNATTEAASIVSYMAAPTAPDVALPASVTTAAATGVITFTPTVAGRKVHVYGLQNGTIEDVTIAAGYDTELSSLELLNDDFYFVLTDCPSAANVAAVATWVSTRAKLYAVSSSSSALLAGTPLASYSSNKRVIVLYASNSHEFAAASWCAYGGANDPGSITWCFKTLPNITTKSLTSTQKNALEAIYGNHYQTIHGRDVPRPGTVTDGEFIDVIHGVDCLTARLQEAVFGLFVDAKKVPITDSGLAKIENVMRGVLKRFEGTAENPALLDEGTSYVIMPKAKTITDADKAIRKVRGIRFGSTLSGAVHSAVLAGTLST